MDVEVKLEPNLIVHHHEDKEGPSPRPPSKKMKIFNMDMEIEILPDPSTLPQRKFKVKPKPEPTPTTTLRRSKRTKAKSKLWKNPKGAGGTRGRGRPPKPKVEFKPKPPVFENEEISITYQDELVDVTVVRKFEGLEAYKILSHQVFDATASILYLVAWKGVKEANFIYHEDANLHFKSLVHDYWRAKGFRCLPFLGMSILPNGTPATLGPAPASEKEEDNLNGNENDNQTEKSIVASEFPVESICPCPFHEDLFDCAAAFERDDCTPETQDELLLLQHLVEITPVSYAQFKKPEVSGESESVHHQEPAKNQGQSESKPKEVQQSELEPKGIEKLELELKEPVNMKSEPKELVSFNVSLIERLLKAARGSITVSKKDLEEAKKHNVEVPFDFDWTMPNLNGLDSQFPCLPASAVSVDETGVITNVRPNGFRLTTKIAFKMPFRIQLQYDNEYYTASHFPQDVMSVKSGTIIDRSLV